MTEAEWLACEEPERMLRQVGKWSRLRGLLTLAGSASAPDPPYFPDERLAGAVSAASLVVTAGTLSEVIAASRGPECDSARVCGLVRDVFGNPCRSSRLDGAWLAWDGGTVLQLAAAVY